MMRRFLIIPLILLSNASLFSQKHFDEWGVVSPEDLAMKSYPADTAAAAVILHDIGSTRIDDDNRRWFVSHMHIRRIKVFNLAAFDPSNLNIFIRAGRSGETLDKIKVQHILPDGTVVKVPSDNLLLEKQNRYYNKMKIFVPQLQDGSIVEYQYEVRSDYLFSLYDWYFHQELPVRWSEITTHIRKEFDYQILSRTGRDFDKKASKTLVDNSVSLCLGLANLPALKEEPFITTLDDYRAYVGFQLSHFYPPNAEPQNIMVSWEKAARDLNKDEDFGDQFEKTSNFKDLWAAFEPTLTPGASPADIAKKVLAFVQSSMSWNGEYRVYTKKDIDDAFAQKKGSSAEMNLAVVALLKKAGLDALPVLVSTRYNGKTHETYPFIQQFNSVLAMLRQGDQHTLLDATHPFLPAGQLRSQHYNNRGWPVVARKESPWIDISAPEFAIVWSGSMKLDEQGQLSGSFSMTGSNSVAANWRESLSSKTPNDFLKKNFATRYPDAVFDSISVENKDDVEKPLRLKFACQIPNTANVINDFIYFNPILDFYVNENPFKSLTRDLPINFTYPIKAQYVVDIAIPPGYQIDEMPTSERINMPNKEGSIVFTCDKMEGNKILIILKMTLTKTEYPAEQYDVLRQYFDMIGKKIATQIVLKKL